MRHLQTYIVQTPSRPTAVINRDETFLVQTSELDFFKQFGHGESRHRNLRPGQTLGGPPSV